MRQHKDVDVVAIGHAIVDVLGPVSDDTVTGLGLTKGTMLLVDSQRSDAIHRSLEAVTTQSGGSAANTCAGLASLGGSAAFVGKVADDEMGAEFASDIRAAGVAYRVTPAAGGPPTGRCLVLITPDAERTMCTDLGAGDHLSAADVDPDLIGRARVLYLEGYMCGLESTREAIAAALDAAESSGTEVALSLSDPFWVQLHGEELAAVVQRCALVFANEAEAMSLTGAGDTEKAAAALGDVAGTAVVTRGPAGCLVASRGQVLAFPAERLETVVDTTGAGDLFASGYLLGHVRGLRPEAAARLGAMAAAEVITHFGARPQAPLAALAVDRGIPLPA
jgi:sugar/nucleoside kinase (ribokinase family)